MMLHVGYNNIRRSLSMMSMYRWTANSYKCLFTIILLY